MAYPPSTIPANKGAQTSTVGDHSSHHNALATAINDITTELGDNPSGDSATVKARLDALAQSIVDLAPPDGLDAEAIRDLIGATLVAGPNVTLTVDDSGDTVTIEATLDVGTGNGGYGPNWIAAADAPEATKTAVTAAGGTVIGSVGTNAASAINTKFASYKHVMLTEGTFSISTQITPSRGSTLQGSGNPATIIKALSGVSGSIIAVTTDKVTLRDFFLWGNGQGVLTAGISVNVTSNSGFASYQPNEACIILSNIQIEDVTGNGVIMAGGFNRDSKLYNIDVHNAGQNGFYITCPDGTLHQCVAGSCGGDGFRFDGASNWRATNCKAWYSVGCGWTLGPTTSTARIGLIGCEAQDNHEAGFRLLKVTAPLLSGCIADSNSNTSGNTGVYSGFEVATNGATTETSWVQSGAHLEGCIAYDKNEGGRGYRQAYGFRFGAGVRYLTAMGSTGDAANHHNLTGAVNFITASDLTHASNLVLLRGAGTVHRSF